MRIKLIALSGYAQSGKDTTAQFLTDNFGYKRVAFADALRDALYALDPIVFQQPGLGTVRIRTLVDNKGWDWAKVNEPEVRSLLQRMGTEVGRNNFGENFWVDQALLKADGHTVFTDCRFPNEASAIQKLGGEVWRIERPGTKPVNAHPSETALDGWDFDRVIHNDGSVIELHQKVAAL